MHEWARLGPNPRRGLGRRYYGLCSTWGVKRGERAGVEVGEILLWGKALGVEIVTHECCHAALGLARRLGVDVRDGGEGVIGGGEERFCGWVGVMVRRIYRRLYRHKVI